MGWLPTFVAAALMCAAIDTSATFFAPFFPLYAIGRNCSHTQIGVVFAAQNIAGLFSTPFAPLTLACFGTHAVLGLSLLVMAVGTAAFGLVDRLHGEHSFFYGCVALRLILGLAASLVDTAATGAVIRAVPERIASDAISWLEAVRSLGALAGP